MHPHAPSPAFAGLSVPLMQPSVARVAGATSAIRLRMVAAKRSPSAPTATPRVWTPASWRSMPILQVPDYPDKEALAAVEDALARSLPLVFSGECDRLTSHLADVAAGKKFVLQGGDCAESFDEFERYGGENVRDTFTLLVQMSILMMYGLRRPVVKILRAAGQFAKPRSSPFECAKNTELKLPSYRGDMINGPAFTLEDRVPDPARMTKAFVQSTATINLLRTLAMGGALDLNSIHDINLKFVGGTREGQRFADAANQIANALAFMKSCGMPTDSQNFRQAEFYTSHECLLLPYEQALCRQDSNGKTYCCSAHMLWIGDRTRQPDGAHVEFLR
jgi:3-deoxy-7-phosphoheptulonate synthase